MEILICIKYHFQIIVCYFNTFSIVYLQKTTFLLHTMGMRYFMFLIYFPEPLAAKILIREIYRYVPIEIFTTDRSNHMKKLFR
jgi:hypothetical protein